MEQSANATVRATIYLDAELHQALRLKSAHGRRSMSQLVNDALRQSLRDDEEDLRAAFVHACRSA